MSYSHKTPGRESFHWLSRPTKVLLKDMKLEDKRPICFEVETGHAHSPSKRGGSQDQGWFPFKEPYMYGFPLIRETKSVSYADIKVSA